jgi:tRNA dimethylallyltransferase
MKQIAIIAPTASGKTALCLKLAHKLNAVILSLDSLAIYKNINIASAKPSIKQRDGIIHFGIDEIYPNEEFDVMKFIDIYKNANNYAIKHNKNLIIVGGTSFYLKAMIDGISYVPKIDKSLQTIIYERFNNHSLKDIYDELNTLDYTYMKDIKSNDKYRIQKAYSLYKQTNIIPSLYFQNNPVIPIIKDIKIYEIIWDIASLRKRIDQRTKIMLKSGLIDEVIYLENKYTRYPNCMSSIGIKETLGYLDGKISKNKLENLITISTAQLAKRQRTFNKGQFKNVIKMPLCSMYDYITSSL